jgi:hypothetical protein
LECQVQQPKVQVMTARRSSNQSKTDWSPVLDSEALRRNLEFCKQ